MCMCYVYKYIIFLCMNKYIYNKLHSFRDIYLMQTLFFKQKKTWRSRPEKKNKSEIVIVYFYASNNPVVEKTSL